MTCWELPSQLNRRLVVFLFRKQPHFNYFSLSAESFNEPHALDAEIDEMQSSVCQLVLILQNYNHHDEQDVCWRLNN